MRASLTKIVAGSFLKVDEQGFQLETPGGDVGQLKNLLAVIGPKFVK